MIRSADIAGSCHGLLFCVVHICYDLTTYEKVLVAEIQHFPLQTIACPYVSLGLELWDVAIHWPWIQMSTDTSLEVMQCHKLP